MSFLFGKSKQKVAQDMVKNAKDLLAKLNGQEGQTAKVRKSQSKAKQQKAAAG